MKNLYLLLPAIVFSQYSYSQNEDAIRQWQLAHPSTQLISSSRFSSLTDADKALLGTDYIVYREKVTIELLEASEAGVKSLNTSEEIIREDESDFIKIWLAEHSDIKILSRSQYTSFSPEEQQLYIENHALILQGEKLTLQDIQNYN